MRDIIFGIHSIVNMLKNNPISLKEIFILDSKKKSNKIKELFYYINKYNINIHKVNKKWLDKKTNNSVHQGIMAVINISKPLTEKDILKIINTSKKIFILILDRITDTHNLGACIRNAVAFNVNMIILPKKYSVKINAMVKKVSCGTSEYIPIIYVKNLKNTINFLKFYKIKIIGTDNNTKNSIIYNNKLLFPICLIMGSEDKGIKTSIKNKCDLLISIPMLNNLNSLNVSVATGICLYEIMKQNFIFNLKN
ncbi:23S rRNA (guanosine(2251)-2'-O)-methyltransferase RlmB [Enterobacteriaceae endosymbiont of Donacia bicoloricornis]|uniref:23S rRNA (guanosine(2251)-2'-O)-methyltransferase RlmB n=1 Tax=Enterobacteriaceae endosymbiont of Donacia bicoloricornis TaxID=2675772 RepID=UPI00144975CE|nr:23S rRNA (guanosine(2251)-2'-O)-methyltransferase RlmB [Enterobacteriaceae endosymbiont of Donacia bicoloricornis]QJC37702.1 23S rRNA (guanosine(2251)-2'-O)-methyltransferase RlmB [Enterobacteriaceae endosymbiont of Donacia bicoloricornis]